MPGDITEGFSSPERVENTRESDQEKKEALFESVVFEHGFDRKGKPIYISDSPDRKRIRLAGSSGSPELTKPYRVKLLKDTKPEDPTKGEYIVEIILSREELEEKGNALMTEIETMKSTAKTRQELRAVAEKVEELQRLFHE